MKTKILLLAHDSLQAQLRNFIEGHEAVLKRFQLMTSNINRKKKLQLTQNLPFNSLQWEELELDTDLETQIINQKIAGVVFLIDSANLQEQEPKIKNLRHHMLMSPIILSLFP